MKYILVGRFSNNKETGQPNVKMVPATIKLLNLFSYDD